MPINEAHEDIDYPADVEYCAHCREPLDVHKCIVIACAVRLHRDCAARCESCGCVMCEEHAAMFDDCEFCPDCLPEVKRLN